MPIVIDISRTIRKAHKLSPTGIDRAEVETITHFARKRTEDLEFIYKPERHAKLCKIPSSVGKFFIARVRHRRLKKNWINDTACRVLQYTLIRAPLPTKRLHRNDIYINLSHENLDDSLFMRQVFASARYVAVMIHDTLPLDLARGVDATSPTRHSNRLANAASCADLIAVNSGATLNALRDRGVLRRRQKTGICRLGADGLGTSMERSPNSRFVIIGTTDWHKNHDLALSAFEIVRNKYRSNADLLLVGRPGNWHDAIQKRVRSNEVLCNAVYLLGPKRDEGLLNILKQANAVLIPSQAEGFGLPAAEAVQLGIPVISAPIDSVNEATQGLLDTVHENTAEAWASAMLERLHNPYVGADTHLPSWQAHADALLAEISKVGEKTSYNESIVHAQKGM